MEKLIEQLVKEIAVQNKLTAMQMINKNPEYFADLTLFPGYCSEITHKVLNDFLAPLYLQASNKE